MPQLEPKMFNPQTDNTMDYREAQDLVERATEMASLLSDRERTNLPYAVATLLVRNHTFARQVEAPNANE